MSADQERARVAKNLAECFAEPQTIRFTPALAIQARFVRGNARDAPPPALSLEFEHDRTALRTAFAFQRFNNFDFDESYGLAIQNPLKPSTKCSRLQVFIEGSGPSRRHMAGTIPFRLTTSELPDPIRARDILEDLGHGADSKFRLWQCTHPFDVLRKADVIPGMLEFLRFTLVLLACRWKDKSSGVRFRDEPSLKMLALLGAQLDALPRTTA